MWETFIQLLVAPTFPGNEEKTRQAHALNILHLNMGAAIFVLGMLGLLFFFDEKRLSSAILITSMMTVGIGMVLNRRGQVLASGLTLLALYWGLTTLMLMFSGGIQSLDMLFFISGTVVAGIILGARGALLYAIWSLLTGLGLILLGETGFEFPRIFTFPPLAAWSILFINLVFTVVPLQATLQSLANSISRARASEERYRLSASVMSDYVFSVQYGAAERVWRHRSGAPSVCGEGVPLLDGSGR